ncbi:hypothetical protein [Bartonella birtlesii]|uniref:hypothetical protein n=1 Tax=Bartonella birtlesii TaxID=111504 RepID=UPI00030C83AC|nr:hypothetical protein [Bartonella birtlesii]
MPKKSSASLVGRKALSIKQNSTKAAIASIILANFCAIAAAQKGGPRKRSKKEKQAKSLCIFIAT